MTNEKKEKTAKSSEFLRDDVEKLEEEIKDLHKKLEGNLTLPLFGRISIAFFGVLLSLWGLIWFGLRAHIRNELLEMNAMENSRYYDLKIYQQILESRLEHLEKSINR